MKFAVIAAACLGLAAIAPASRLLDPAYLGAGSNPRGLASADINGDGYADLAVANFGSGTLIGAACPASGGSISLFYGSSQGLKPGPVIPVATDAPRGLAFADLENNGKPDLLATLYCSGSLQVYHNNGDGTFTLMGTYATGAQPVGVAAQVSGGGGLVAVADYGSNKVSVFIVKMGVLTLASTLAVGTNPTDVRFYPQAAGRGPVLFVADYGSNAVTRLSLSSDGAQAGSADIPVPGQPCKLAVGDLNNDGLPDLAVARFTDSAVDVFLGQSDGSLAVSPAAQTLAGSHPNGLALGRLGGALSLVTADRDSDQIEVLRWAGLGLSRCA
ncbi:MAG TPA: VCBS repeat-containing protein, partial [bacterium]|nr:VCBS repeat-containing protein [bacterium]